MVASKCATKLSYSRIGVTTCTSILCRQLPQRLVKVSLKTPSTLRQRLKIWSSRSTSGRDLPMVWLRRFLEKAVRSHSCAGIAKKAMAEIVPIIVPMNSHWGALWAKV